jgi:shikimate kinase
MPTKSDVIVLIGPMGVGKTTVGKKLARAMKVAFSDTDNLITQEHGSIAEYFANHGEDAFRQVEHTALKHALANPGVVATGGGAVLLQESRDLLKDATVVYLATDGKHMASRLKNGSRPLLKNGIEDWKRIYEARKAFYEATADVMIDTSGHPLAQTISEIRERLNIK